VIRRAIDCGPAEPAQVSIGVTELHEPAVLGTLDLAGAFRPVLAGATL
jgi:hypothetical protein